MSTPIVHEAVQRTRTYAHGDRDARSIFAKRLIGKTDVHEYCSGMYCDYVAKERTLMATFRVTTSDSPQIQYFVIVFVQNTVYKMQFANIHAMMTM